ncbi:hypothetical protein AHAS_Ahas14G0197400 [Arachis hypogaea]
MPVPLPYQSSFDDWLLRRHWICLLRLTLLYGTSATHHSPLYDWVDTVYDTGYRYRNCGLMLTWLVMGAMSLAVVHIARAFGGAKNLWGAGNFILVGGLAMTVYISNLAKDERLERHLDLRF